MPTLRMEIIELFAASQAPKWTRETSVSSVLKNPVCPMLSPSLSHWAQVSVVTCPKLPEHNPKWPVFFPPL